MVLGLSNRAKIEDRLKMLLVAFCVPFFLFLHFTPFITIGGEAAFDARIVQIAEKSDSQDAFISRLGLHGFSQSDSDDIKRRLTSLARWVCHPKQRGFVPQRKIDQCLDTHGFPKTLQNGSAPDGYSLAVYDKGAGPSCQTYHWVLWKTDNDQVTWTEGRSIKACREREPWSFPN